MEKEKQEIIEELLETNYFYCPEILNLYGFFGIMANEYLNATCEYLPEKEEDENREELVYEDMNIHETIGLVREFLKTIDIKYLNQFDKFLVDGTIELFLPEDDLIERPSDPIATPKPFPCIYIPVENTVADGGKIIHELFHVLNDTEDFVGVREIFTEMISIYYELRYYQFLKEKGYGDIHLYQEIYERIDASFDSANDLCYSNSVLDIYENTGDVTKKNIKFLDKYRNLYKDNITDIINFINSEEFEEVISEYNDGVGYVLGTLLTFMALKEPKIYDLKMKCINENINYIKIEDVLNILDTKLSDYPIWIEECVVNLKEALGEIYEEDNLYSGTDRSR